MWTCMWVLGLAKNIRPNYPHLTHYQLCQDSDHVVIKSCSEHANTRNDLMSWWWYGTLIKAWVYLDPFTWGWSGRSTPFILSPLLSINLLFPYHMLTLGLSHNCWYQSIFHNVSFVGRWWTDVSSSWIQILINKATSIFSIIINFLFFLLPFEECLYHYVIISMIHLCCRGNPLLYKVYICYICIWGQYLNCHVFEMTFISYVYEVNTSIA